MLRVTADTNVLVSGLTFQRGNPAAFLELARARRIELAVSDAILDEMAEVLARKFHWPVTDISGAKVLLMRHALRVIPGEVLDLVKDDLTIIAFSNARSRVNRIVLSLATNTCCGWERSRAYRFRK